MRQANGDDPFVSTDKAVEIGAETAAAIERGTENRRVVEILHSGDGAR